MKNITYSAGVILLSTFVNLSGMCEGVTVSEPTYPDPARFEKNIQSFESHDLKKPKPKGAVLCTGSSSMRHWHPTIREDLEPLTLITRGFGGSNFNDLIHYADRMVFPYEPRAIVVYEGDNDIGAGIEPEVALKHFEKFVALVHERLPDCRIYFLSVKPSIRRWEMWPDMAEVNAGMAAFCEKDERLTYVDMASAMIGKDGLPKKDIFQKDKLHMNREGYLIWTEVLRPILLENELQFEKE